MALTVDQVAAYLTNEVQPLIQTNEQKILLAMEADLKGKGLISKFVGTVGLPLLGSWLFGFVVNTILPAIIRGVVYSLVMILGPRITPFINIITDVLELVNESNMSAEDKAIVIDLLSLLATPQTGGFSLEGLEQETGL